MALSLARMQISRELRPFESRRVFRRTAGSSFRANTSGASATLCIFIRFGVHAKVAKAAPLLQRQHLAIKPYRFPLITPREPSTDRDCPGILEGAFRASVMRERDRSSSPAISRRRSINEQDLPRGPLCDTRRRTTFAALTRWPATS